MRNLEQMGQSLLPSEVHAVLESAIERPLYQIKAGLEKNGLSAELYDLITKNDSKFTTKRKVSVLMGVDYTHDKAYLVNWMEYGTAPRYKKDGSYTGQIVARPVIRPAWDMNEKSMVDYVLGAIEDIVIKEGKKHGLA